MRVLRQNIKNRYVKSFLYWSLVILISWLLQIALTSPLCAQRPPAANEVAVYEHINYVGDQLIYALEPAMRQKIVRFIPNPLAGKISSIQVGANVGVAFWNSYDFYGEGNATLQSINNLSVMPTYHDKIMSLIIFPKEWKYPMGVLIIGKYWIDSWDGKKVETPLAKFYPAPEKMMDHVAPFPDIGYQFINNNTDAHVRPDSMHPIFKQVSVKLCEQKNFGGKCITIPGPGGGLIQHFKLSDYQFENKVASLQVIHNYPVSVSAKQPIPAVKQVAPVRTQMQKVPIPPIGANEVAVWDYINYRGAHETYTLEPGMRQKLVPLLPATVRDKISSIQVGANVGVAFWPLENFRGLPGAEGSSYSQSIDDLGGDRSVYRQYNDRIRSLIIFPKGWQLPMGALCTMQLQVQNQKTSSADFYPAPEKMTDRIAYFPKVHPVDGQATQVSVGVRPSPEHPILKEVRIKLCDQENLGGKCVTMPPAGANLMHTNYFQLSNYGFYNKVLSLQVIHNYPATTPARTPIGTPSERMPVQRR